MPDAEQGQGFGGCQGALNAISAPAPAAAKPEPKPSRKRPRPGPNRQPAARRSRALPPAAAAQRRRPAARTEPAPSQSPHGQGRRHPGAPRASGGPAGDRARTRSRRRHRRRSASQPKLGEAILIRRFCTTDFRVLCKGVPLGQGRAIQCLANNGPALSPGCRDDDQTGELRY